MRITKHQIPTVGLNRHHRVVWQDPANRLFCILASLGFSNRTICSHTGLTNCQVSYRCKKRVVKLTDYRNGIGTRAEATLAKYALRRKRMSA